MAWGAAWGAETLLAHICSKRNHYAQWRHLSHYDFFVTALHGIDVNDVWFEQNGATCHTYHVTINLLRQMYGPIIG